MCDHWDPGGQAEPCGSPSLGGLIGARATPNCRTADKGSGKRKRGPGGNFARSLQRGFANHEHKKGEDEGAGWAWDGAVAPHPVPLSTATGLGARTQHAGLQGSCKGSRVCERRRFRRSQEREGRRVCLRGPGGRGRTEQRGKLRVPSEHGEPRVWRSSSSRSRRPSKDPPKKPDWVAAVGEAAVGEAPPNPASRQPPRATEGTGGNDASSKSTQSPDCENQHTDKPLPRGQQQRGPKTLSSCPEPGSMPSPRRLRSETRPQRSGRTSPVCRAD